MLRGLTFGVYSYALNRTKLFFFLSRFKDHPTLNERYLLLHLLGRGGFSEVYKVECVVSAKSNVWAMYFCTCNFQGEGGDPNKQKDYNRYAL